MPVIPQTDFLISLPELGLAGAAMLLLMLGVFRGNAYGEKLGILSLGVLLLTLMLVVDSRHMLGDAYFHAFRSSLFTMTMKVLIVSGAAMVLFISLPQLKGTKGAPFEFSILLLLSTLGLMLMVSANDLLSLYVGLELASLALYVLAAHERENTRSSEAGMKYFVLGALASGMLLYGISLVYGFAGTTHFTGLAEVLKPMTTVPIGIVVGLVFVLVGMCFKMSAVPFHMWTPDVYEGAPTQVTAFFATAPKVAAVALVVRLVMEPFHGLVGQWQQILIFVSVASMLVGAFAALRQTNIKRLLAYSSIGHVGYLLMGVAVNTLEGVQGVVIYLTLYVVMAAGVFACIMVMSRKGKTIEAIEDMRGLSRQHPRTAAAMAVFMFSMSGIPPLAGFFGKMMVFLAVVEAGFMWLAVIGVLSSVVAAFYYLRIVKVMYLDEVEHPLDRDQNVEGRVLLAVTGLANLLFFIYPSPLFNWAKQAAMSLGIS